MTKEQIALKNYIHNTLKISKKDIKEITEEVIRKEIKSKVKRYFEQNNSDINKKMLEAFEDAFKYNINSFGSVSFKLKERVVNSLTKELSKKLTLKYDDERI